ncbi:hypothetical protein [Peribacillus frigoritolerans]
MISDETWEKAQSILKSRSRTPNKYTVVSILLQTF